MRVVLGVVAVAALVPALFLFAFPRAMVVAPAKVPHAADGNAIVVLPAGPPESEPPTSTIAGLPKTRGEKIADLPPQPQLPNPPTVTKGLYLTGWSAGLQARVNSTIALMKKRGLNAVVIDVKDYSGYISYETKIAEVSASGAEDQPRIRRPNAVIKQFHDNGIYLIARITVFQDPILAKAHPEWALKNKSNGKVWHDRKGLSWMDPAARPVWDYNVAIAKDALARGFDEVNFDYIRFPSDGSLDNISYPFWDRKMQMSKVIAKFFAYVREVLPEARLSADLFGLTTVADGDLGIGQVIEDAYRHFDYVYPMVYPSHFAPGFLGYKNPAGHPYEVIEHALEGALGKRSAYGKSQMANGTTTANASSETLFATSHLPLAKIRPWLQDFDLGAVYDGGMVAKEIQATEDVLLRGSDPGQFAGWFLWDPSNNYR